MALITSPPVVIGIPEVPFAIPGFSCRFEVKEFAKARNREGEDFFICDHENRWELWRCLYNSRITLLNPRGESVTNDMPIIIKK